MKKFLAAAVLSAFALPVFAVGTFVPAIQPRDMVHDDARSVVYISTETEVLRYQLGTGTFLSPIVLGGYLGGIDISPDNRFLVIADQMASSGGPCMHIVDLTSMAQQLACAPAGGVMESGSEVVAYGADGTIYVTPAAFNMASVPLRRFDPASGQWSDVTTAARGMRLSPSGDAQTIGFVDYIYPGSQWGFIDVPTGTVVRRAFPESRFANGVAVDRLGAQFSVLGEEEEGAFVFDDVYSHIGNIAITWPQAFTYHPVERLAYLSAYNSPVLHIYDTNSLQQVGSFDFGGPTGSIDTARLSRDGSLILAMTFDGVYIHQQYAPLQSGAIGATTNLGQAKTMGLLGSVGNGGSVSFSIASPPAHGTVSISGGNATYTPAAGYVGADAFTYRAHYGRAVRTATVSMSVIDPNRAPVAVNDSAQARNTAILIPVLANDSDPDGDTLSLVSVTTPNAGAATIQGTKVLFTPPKKWPASITFNYTISDGRGKTATAKVTVTRN